MSRRPVVVLPPAKAEAADAFRWLEGVRPGFGAVFTEELRAVIDRIEQSPDMYQSLALPQGKEARRAVLHLFDYALVYRVLPGVIEIVAVSHCRMDPASAHARAAAASE